MTVPACCIYLNILLVSVKNGAVAATAAGVDGDDDDGNLPVHVVRNEQNDKRQCYSLYYACSSHFCMQSSSQQMILS